MPGTKDNAGHFGRPPGKKDGPPVTVRVIEYTVHTAPAAGGQATSATNVQRYIQFHLLEPWMIT